MLVTDNGEWADLARRLRSHGITRAPESFRGLTRPDDWQGSPQAGFPVDALRETGPWYYEMQDLGWNYRITDIQCALGRSQLRKLPQFIARRQEIARRYSEALADLPWLETPALAEPLVTEASAHQFHYGAGDVSLHLYTVQMDFVSLGHSRTRVMELLRSKGVGTQVLYIPVYLQPWYRRTFGYVPGKCPVAEKFYARALSLPLFPAMADEDVDRVISAVRSLTTS
jgi:perosamine synthetase